MKIATRCCSRRLIGVLLSLLFVFTLTVIGPPRDLNAATAKVLNIGMTFPLSGADAEEAFVESHGALLAIEEANARGGVAGYKIEPIILDDATATAGGYDVAQGATNVRKLIATPGVIADIGPMNSAIGLAVSPLLSEGDLATVAPSTTNPDITSPKLAATFRPMGKAVYFRTSTTDKYLGAGLANFFAERLGVKSVFVLDDSSAYGVGLADVFEARAGEKGIRVVGRDRLNPREADYATIVTKIKGTAPQAIYYGGTTMAGVTLAKQLYTIFPEAIKGAGGGMYKGDVLKAVGFPGISGWYVTAAAPHLLDNPRVRPWVARYVKRWGRQPSDYAVTAYDAALVIMDAIDRVVKTGKPVDRHTIRDAIQTTHLRLLQGVIAFDENGDLTDHAVSLYQIIHDPKYPEDDVLHQYKYVGVTPAN